MKEYFEYEGLNYSTLAALDSNYPGKVFEDSPKKESTPAMSRGSLVDCLLTSPEEFEELFVIVDIPTLTPSLTTVIDYMLEHELEYNDTNIISAYRQGGGRWTDSTIIKNIKTDNTLNYYTEKKKLTTNKIQISQIDYEKALAVIEVLKTHEFSSWIFEQKRGLDIYFQLPIYWKEKGIPCKALLDILLVDHNNKMIRPIDLKIKSDSKYSFPSSFMRYKYYLQASWYTRGLRAKLHPSLKDYKIENFTFLVTTFDYPEPPLLYRCSNDLLRIAKYGNQDIKGVETLFRDYIWYKKEGLFNYPKELHLSKGVIELNM